MPLYDFRCANGHKFERHVPLAKFEEQQLCDCHAPANRIISAPMFSVDQTDYSCPITGKHIGSKRQHEENLKLHNCRVLETGEKESNERRRQEADAALDRKIEDTVEREVESLSSDKKEKLYNELISTDLTVERK